MLKYDPGSNALSNLLPPDLPLEHAHLFAYCQLAARGQKRQASCARHIAHQAFRV